jgi:hypothetical protein
VGGAISPVRARAASALPAPARAVKANKTIATPRGISQSSMNLRPYGGFLPLRLWVPETQIEWPAIEDGLTIH